MSQFSPRGPTSVDVVNLEPFPCDREVDATALPTRSDELKSIRETAAGRKLRHCSVPFWPSEVVATLPWRDVVWAHADQQTEIRHMHFAQFIHRTLHRKASDSPAAAVLARGNAAYAADLDVTRVPLGVANEQADMADDASVARSKTSTRCSVSRATRHYIKNSAGAPSKATYTSLSPQAGSISPSLISMCSISR
jgi:hypothetical protein